jgi:hypothetical protein
MWAATGTRTGTAGHRGMGSVEFETQAAHHIDQFRTSLGACPTSQGHGAADATPKRSA